MLRHPDVHMSEYSALHVSAPCDELFIYYLEGSLKNDPLGLLNFIGNWQEDGFTFLFFSSPAMDQVQRLTSAADGLRFIDQYQMSYQDWVGEKLAPFHTKLLSVSPPWSPFPPEPDKKQIILDPGVVFGAGSHPTTRNCLEAIECAWQFRSVTSALDLGTGTGILAIAAACLGCAHVLAVDINRLAVQTTLRNIRLNRLENRILAVQSSATDCLHWYSDLLIANIHYDVMKQLVRSDGFLKHHMYILSGLLRSEAADIESQLKHLPLILMQKWDQNGIWFTFWFVRKY